VVGVKGVGLRPEMVIWLSAATATSSSEANDYYGAYRLTDGDQGTYFESHDR